MVVGTFALLIGPTQLVDVASATFPGKNGRLAFLREHEGGSQSIETVKPSGRARRTLDQSGSGPGFSADGRLIVFARYGGKHPGLWTMRSDGSHKHHVPSKAGDFHPRFSPDGRKIVFERAPGAAHEVWLTDVGGHNRHRISSLTGGGGSTGWSNASFSPNGKRLVFEGPDRQIWVAKANGANAHAITHPGGFGPYSNQPDWAPNGKTIVFHYNDVPTTGEDYLQSIRPDGSHRHLIVADPHGFGGPVFSPDGKLIAYRRGGGASSRIWIVHSDGTHMRHLTSGTSANWDAEPLSWQPIPRKHH
jgi:TolB protein